LVVIWDGSASKGAKMLSCSSGTMMVHHAALITLTKSSSSVSMPGVFAPPAAMVATQQLCHAAGELEV
jgi:hypothetical protein